MQFATLLKGVAFLASTSLILSANIPVRDGAVSLPISGDSAPLDSRGVIQGRFCIMDGIPGQNWYAVPAHGGIATALHNLRLIPSEFLYIGAGPGFCRQMACAYNAAIWCCNDNRSPFSVETAVLADMALTIISNCLRGEWTGGQLFNSDGYNVIINSVTQCDVGCTYGKGEELVTPSINAREADISPPVERDLALEPRGTYLGLFCIKDSIPGQNWDWIDISSGYIDQAIALIDNGGPDAGNFVSGAGPAYCGQITCVDRSAVYWCNDNPQAISVDSHDLALMAKYIVQKCKETIPWWHTFSGGQLFNSDGYNIIVRDGECDGAGAKRVKREDLMAEIDGRAPNAAVENKNTARADDGVPVDLQCPPALDWEYADYDAVIWGYEYLKDIVQPINVEPQHCLKVFCIGSSGIFVCNPSQGAWLTISSEEVADLVLTLANTCHAGTYTGGQIWDSDGWFVQIVNTSC